MIAVLRLKSQSSRYLISLKKTVVDIIKTKFQPFILMYSHIYGKSWKTVIILCDISSNNYCHREAFYLGIASASFPIHLYFVLPCSNTMISFSLPTSKTGNHKTSSTKVCCKGSLQQLPLCVITLLGCRGTLLQKTPKRVKTLLPSTCRAGGSHCHSSATQGATWTPLIALFRLSRVA